jgi:hypothetical protein
VRKPRGGVSASPLSKASAGHANSSSSDGSSSGSSSSGGDIAAAGGDIAAAGGDIAAAGALEAAKASAVSQQGPAGRQGGGAAGRPTQWILPCQIDRTAAGPGRSRSRQSFFRWGQFCCLLIDPAAGDRTHRLDRLDPVLAFSLPVQHSGARRSRRGREKATLEAAAGRPSSRISSGHRGRRGSQLQVLRAAGSKAGGPAALGSRQVVWCQPAAARPGRGAGPSDGIWADSRLPSQYLRV